MRHQHHGGRGEVRKAHVIALAADSPLYAPLYIAQAAGFFANNSVQFGVFRRNPRQEKHTGKGSRKNGARSSALLEEEVQTVWKAFAETSRPLLTVCDPMHALVHNLWPGKRRRISLVGGLIVRPACWFFDSVATFEEFLQRLRLEKHAVIRTHAPGMTADTLTRWMLFNKGRFALQDVERVMDYVASPGQELDAFDGTIKKLRGAVGAVSVDFARMLQLQESRPSQFGICEDFSHMLPDYLMTGILVDEAIQPEQVEIVKQILCGINLGINVLMDDPDRAFELLVYHYRMRVNADNFAVAKCEYLQALDPVMGEDNAARSLKPIIHDLASVGLYPPCVYSFAMREALEVTWKIYRQAHEDILPELCNSSCPEDAGALPVRETLTLIEEKRVLTSLSRSFARKNSLLAPHPDVEKVVNWIKSLQGVLRMSDFQVFDRFICGNKKRLGELRTAFDRIQTMSNAAILSATPAAFCIFGEPGSGKDTFARGVLQSMISKQALQSGPYVNVFGLREMKDVFASLDQQFKKCEGQEIHKPIGVFINEIDKLKDDAIFGKFSPYILVDAAELKKRGISPTLVKRTVWIFCGTLLGERDAVKRRIVAAIGGKDFWERVGDEQVFTLRKPSDPIEQVMRFVAVACTNPENEADPNRPLNISPSLLLWCAVQDFSKRENRDINRLMYCGRLMMNQRTDRCLKEVDTLTAGEMVVFHEMYRDHIASLPTEPVKIEYDI
jgi:hypothetical protein